MEVGKINRNINKVHVAKPTKVAFGGGQHVINSTQIKKEICKNMPESVKKMLNLEWLKGEVGGILITAIGTGLVAPIFIAFNPLSDKDEDTKKYTALRQPVSAVLAILIQLGLLKPLGAIYDILSNEGKLGNSIGFNQEKLHSESYWKNEAKKAKLTVEQTENIVRQHRINDVQNVATELHEKGYIEYSDGRKVDRKTIGESINSALDERIKNYNEIIDGCSDSKITAKSKRAFVLLTKNDKNENVIKILCEKLCKSGNYEAATTIIEKWKKDYVNGNKDLLQIADEFIRRSDINNLRGRADSTLNKINCFESAVKNAEILKQNSVEIIKGLELIKGGDESALSSLKELLRSTADNSEVGGLSQILEVVENTTDKDTRVAYIDKYLARIKGYVEADGDLEKILKIYQTGYYTDKKDMAIASKTLLESLKLTSFEALDNAKSTIANIAEKLGLTSDKKFETEIVEQLRSKIEKKVKGYKQVTSILVGLFITLPLTCSVLNWVYPRFMNIFFPELANSKKSEAPEEKAKTGGKK